MTEDDSNNNNCFLSVSIGGEIQTKIVIELDIQRCPKTCQSFLELCCSPHRTTPKSPKPCYKGCHFHRIVPQFVLQAGDFENFNGTGGFSPLWGKKFPDENFILKHDRPGCLSMANSGKNSNGSQFFITLKSTPHLDGKHVVFGKVISGMETVHKIESVERDQKDCPIPLQRVVIEDCGIVKEQYGTNSEGESNSSSWGEKNRSRRRNKTIKRRSESHKKRNRKASEDSDASEDSSGEQRRKRKRKSRHDRHDDSSTSDDGSDSSSNDKHKRRKEKKKRKKRHKKHRER
jgi:peptidyl-prolyl isomerase G (cyclophilin G)